MKALKHAFNGIIYVFKNEKNFKIHIVASIAVIIAGIWFSIDKTEWFAIIFAVTMVIVTETINSAIEYLCDFISPEYHKKIKIIKDTAAAAVLIAAIGAVVIGITIFLPEFF